MTEVTGSNERIRLSRASPRQANLSEACYTVRLSIRQKSYARAQVTK